VQYSAELPGHRSRHFKLTHYRTARATSYTVFLQRFTASIVRGVAVSGRAI
jgi:hypothetical protein